MYSIHIISHSHHTNRKKQCPRNVYTYITYDVYLNIHYFKTRQSTGCRRKIKVRTRLSKICQETTSLPKRSNDQKPKAKSTTPTLSQTAEIKSPSQKDRKRYRSLHICKKLKRAAVKYTLVESDPLFTLSFFFCQAEGIRDGCKGRDKKRDKMNKEMKKIKDKFPLPIPA